MSEQQELIKLSWVSESDPTVWLEDNNDGQEPVIIPRFPNDSALLACYISSDGSLGVALSRRSMFAVRHPDLLWFCNVKRSELAKVANPSLVIE